VRKSLLDLKLSWVAVIFVMPELETLYDLARALCKDEKVERPASDMQQHAVVFQESKHWETAGTAEIEQPCDCRLARAAKRSAPCIRRAT
jgi:hypothetical protein